MVHDTKHSVNYFLHLVIKLGVTLCKVKLCKVGVYNSVNTSSLRIFNLK